MYDTITEDCIAELVDSFYGRIHGDPVLYPIFSAAIGTEWGPHLEKMTRFWSTVLLASRAYKGNPMVAHLQLPRLTGDHFDRWMHLWKQTVESLCSKEVAQVLIEKAEMIGERLLHVISSYHEAAFQGPAQGAA